MALSQGQVSTSEKRSSFRVFVQDISSEKSKRPLSLRPWATIKDLKQLLSSTLRLPPSLLTLYFGHQTLPNHWTLQDSGIYRSGETILYTIFATTNSANSSKVNGGMRRAASSNSLALRAGYLSANGSSSCTNSPVSPKRSISGASLNCLTTNPNPNPNNNTSFPTPSPATTPQITIISALLDKTDRSLLRTLRKCQLGMQVGRRPKQTLEGSGGTYLLEVSERSEHALRKTRILAMCLVKTATDGKNPLLN